MNVAHTAAVRRHDRGREPAAVAFLFEHSVRPEFTCRFQWQRRFGRAVGQPVRDAQPDQRLPRPHPARCTASPSPGDVPPMSRRCAARSRGRRSPRWSATARAASATPRPSSTATGASTSRRCGAMVDDAARGADRVGHRARRPGRGVGAELARVDRRRARRHDRGRRARADQHPLPRRGGGVRPRAQRRARAVHRARVPRHRLPGAARERGRRAARARAHDPARGRARRRRRSAGTTSSRADAAVSDAELDARVASIGPDDPSDVVFTSGTTGSPKGVVMTHGQTLRAYLDWCDWADLRPGDRYLIANPFFHIFGYKAGCLACLMRGATIFPLAVFDAGVVLEIVERERISVLPGPPTIYQSLLDHPDRATPRHLEPARRRDRRGRHPGRAHPARPRGAAVRAHPHRLRAHRGRHGHRQPARRRLRAHRDDRRRAVARLRGAHRRPSRAPTPRRANRARSSCAARR